MLTFCFIDSDILSLTLKSERIFAYKRLRLIFLARENNRKSRLLICAVSCEAQFSLFMTAPLVFLWPFVPSFITRNHGLRLKLVSRNVDVLAWHFQLDNVTTNLTFTRESSYAFPGCRHRV